MELHHAMTRAILAYEAEKRKQPRRARNEMFTKHRRGVRNAVDNALARLQRFLDSLNASENDPVRDAACRLSNAMSASDLFRQRYETRRLTAGRPSEHSQTLEEDLRNLKIPPEDRKTVKAALGFIIDPDPT